MWVVASTDDHHRLQTASWRRALLWGARHLPPSVKLATMPLWAAIPFVLVPRARRQIAKNLERRGPFGGARARARRDRHDRPHRTVAARPLPARAVGPRAGHARDGARSRCRGAGGRGCARAAPALSRGLHRGVVFGARALA